MKRVLIVWGLLVAAFAGGYLPQYLKNRGLESSLAEARQQLRVAALDRELGMILVEVEQINFGNAKDRSTRFFDEARNMASEERDPALQQRLTAILKQRDEITSDLTAANPETAAKLRKMYKELLTRAEKPL